MSHRPRRHVDNYVCPMCGERPAECSECGLCAECCICAINADGPEDAMRDTVGDAYGIDRDTFGGRGEHGIDEG